MTEEVSKEQIKGENGTGIDEAKRLKEKKGANMVVKILAIVLVPLIAIAVIAIEALNSAGDRISDAMMKHELAATEYALEMSLNNSAPGDFSYENGALYKGELNLTDNKQVLDALKQNAGVDVALFWGSDLAVTKLTGGTITLSEKVASKVLGGESYFSNLISALQECAEEAGKYQVYLGLEVINRYESDVINTVKEGLEFLEMVGSPWLQLHLDTYHMNIEESDIKKSIQSAKGKICHVHVADNDRWFVGHGHYDFAETLGALKEIGYTGAVSVESFGFPDMISSARASYENMRHIMNQL